MREYSRVPRLRVLGEYSFTGGAPTSETHAGESVEPDASLSTLALKVVGLLG